MSEHWWVKFTHFYCPQCGRESVIRERREPPKPADYTVRHEVIEHWDGCGAL